MPKGTFRVTGKLRVNVCDYCHAERNREILQPGCHCFGTKAAAIDSFLMDLLQIHSHPTAMPDLQYPVGKFSFPKSVTAADRGQWISQITETPRLLREAALSLSPAELDTPYRPGGWTARQVIHHVPESHMNAYIRFKLALTEDKPTIKPYAEGEWAKLPDVSDTPIEVSLALLDSLHDRWVRLLRLMSDADWNRQFVHPVLGEVRLDQNLALYAWHGRHHTAHVRSIKSA